MKTNERVQTRTGHWKFLSWSFASLVIMMGLGSSRGQVIAVNTTESPYTLGKGVIELTGFYTVQAFGKNYGMARYGQPGIRIGAGLTDRLDLKFAYYRDFSENISDGFNLYQVILKIGGKSGRLAFYIPTGVFHYVYTAHGEKKLHELIYFFSPKINGALALKPCWDISMGGYFNLLTGFSGESLHTCGLSFGSGYVTKSRKLSVRGEVGFDILSLACGFPIWNIGVSVSYLMKAGKAKGQAISKEYNRHSQILSQLVEWREEKKAVFVRVD